MRILESKKIDCAKLLIILVTLFGLLAFAEKSLACSCVSSPESIKKQVKGAFSDSTAIFEGEVLSAGKSLGHEFELIVKLKISKSWKGEQSGEITITTPSEGSLCGYDFAIGKTYLVYANGTKEKLSVYNCSRTMDLSNNADVKYLRKLKPKKTDVMPQQKVLFEKRKEYQPRINAENADLI